MTGQPNRSELAAPQQPMDSLLRSAMPARMLLVLGIAILLAAFGRVWILATGPSHPPDLTEVRQTAESWLAANWPPPVGDDGAIDTDSLDAELVDQGVLRIELQRFDPKALVVIRPGKDGQPGVAGVDDNGDAVIDNRSELGATRSDDRCEVIPSGQPTSGQDTMLILQRGAFVPATTSAANDSSAEQRAVVIGRTDQQSWSFLLPPPL